MYNLIVEREDGSEKIEFTGTLAEVLDEMVCLAQDTKWLTTKPKPVKWKKIKIEVPVKLDKGTEDMILKGVK